MAMAMSFSCPPSCSSSSSSLTLTLTHRKFAATTRTTFAFLSRPPHSHSPSPLTYRLISPPKVSEVEPSVEEAASVAVAVADPDTDTNAGPEGVEVEQSQSVEETPVKGKGEEVFAVVVIGGRQYMVFPGRYLYTQRLKGAKVNDKVILNKVLLVGTKTSAYIGAPVVTNAAVHAVVEEQGLDPKVVVFKYKKKKNYSRNIGHRQPNTRLRILGITGYHDYPVVTLDDIKR